MRPLSKKCAALFAFTIALVLPRISRANPLDTFGFGSRETAMGGAVSADVADFSANYYNPAGLARAKSLEISIGYFRADHFLKINGKESAIDPVRGIVAGVVAPGELFSIPFAFGLGLHLPDARISRIRALPQQEPRWELYDNRNQRLVLNANLAISPFSWLQIGGGLSFMAATEGELDISGDANILNPQSSQLRHQVNADLTAVRYPQFGARIQLSKRASLAIVYRGQFQLDLDLKAKLQGDLAPFTTAYYALEAQAVDAFLPQQIVVGGSWQVTDRVKANADFTWVNWSAYIAPVAHLDVDLNIPPPAGGWPANITPPTVPVATKIVPLQMHDRLVPHLGVEWKAIALPKFEAFVRGGYEYQKTPIPAQTGVTNYIDRDRHAFSAGIGGKLIAPTKILPGDVRLDLHAQLIELTDGLTLKSDPTDVVGDYTAGGHIWNVGFTTTVAF